MPFDDRDELEECEKCTHLVVTGSPKCHNCEGV